MNASDALKMLAIAVQVVSIAAMVVVGMRMHAMEKRIRARAEALDWIAKRPGR